MVRKKITPQVISQIEINKQLFVTIKHGERYVSWRSTEPKIFKIRRVEE